MFIDSNIKSSIHYFYILILLPYQFIHELKCRVDDLRSFSCFYSSVSQFVVCSNTQ